MIHVNLQISFIWTVGGGGMALSILAGFFNPSKQASTPMACVSFPSPPLFPDFTPILVKLAIVTYFRCKSFAKQVLSSTTDFPCPINEYEKCLHSGVCKKFFCFFFPFFFFNAGFFCFVIKKEKGRERVIWGFFCTLLYLIDSINLLVC